MNERKSQQHKRIKEKAPAAPDLSDTPLWHEPNSQSPFSPVFLISLLDTIPYPVFFKDREGIYRYCNPAFFQFNGGDASRFIGKTIFEAVPDLELASVYHRADLELMDKGGTQVYESQIKSWNGDVHHVIFNKIAVTNDKGQVTGLLGFVVDITAQKESEFNLQAQGEEYKSLYESYLSKNDELAELVRNLEQQNSKIEHINKELRISEAKFSSIVCNSIPVIFMLDAQGVFLLSEGRMLKSLNLKPGEVVGRSIYEVYGAYPHIIQSVEMALAGKSSNATVELGNLVFEAFYSPLPGLDKQIGGVIGMAIDVTERNQAQAELRRQNAEYQTLNEEYIAQNEALRSALDLVSKHKSELENLNKELRQSRKALKMKLDYLLSPDSDETLLNVAEVIDSEKLQAMQEAFSSATGLSSYITDTSGRFLVSPVNLPAICQAARNTERGKERCRTSAAELGILAKEQAGPVVAACQNCGLMQAAVPLMIGSRHAATWFVGPWANQNITDRQFKAHVSQFQTNADAFANLYSELEPYDLNQVEKIIRLHWFMARELSALSFNNLRLARQIEEHKQTQIKLQRAREKAEESDRLKSAFLANMSHEIRTPMNSIMGFANLLTNSYLPETKRREFADIINSSGNQLLRLISDIIDLSKIEAGQVKIEWHPDCLNRLMNELHLRFRMELQNRNKGHIELQLEKGLTDQDSLILTDEVRLTQILTNLLNNAIKFTESGTISFGYHTHSDDELHFFVRDSGKGISENDRALIFERFRQASGHDERKYGGTGLGLSICKGLVTLFGGRIWVEPSEKPGAEFRFVIPYRQAEVSTPLKPDMTTFTPASEHTIAGKIILVVEDDILIRRYFESVLIPEGAILHFAKTAAEAMKICESECNISLILMDIRLPDGNGLELTAHLRAQGVTTPIIAQTAFALSGDYERVIEAGCNDYITKPILREKLLAMLHKYL